LDDGARLASLVTEADLVVSLLPYTLHVKVARVAIAHRVPLITTSYVSAEMRALDGAAREAGVLVLNEIGLDPGLDHMSAMRAIHQVRSEGSCLVSFRSCCGGLPAPEANTNPWGYKFSWSPRGVLAAGLNAARWIEDGRIVDVPGPELFSHAAAYDVPEVGRLEVYPNRDATAYVATYGIEGVRTMFRGTLRYPGWCETLRVVSRLGLLDDVPRTLRTGATYEEFMEAFAEPGTGPVAERVAARAGIRADGAVMERLHWAGLFSDRRLGSSEMAPIEALCARLAECLAYAPAERDMIVLRHEFGVVGHQGRHDRRVSTLVAFGEPEGDSAMARTVSLPAAVAARLILDGRIASTGVRIPVDPEIYEPVLEALAPMGIVFRETRTAP
jgi:saccharopine dehydrogenase-like NADP-dependent oxidoreductase